MVQEVVAVATTLEVIAWVVSITVWAGVSIMVYINGMTKRNKIEAFPYVMTMVILWPLIALIQGTRRLPLGVRVAVKGLWTFITIFGRGAQVTLRGELPKLPAKKPGYY